MIGEPNKPKMTWNFNSGIKLSWQQQAQTLGDYCLLEKLLIT